MKEEFLHFIWKHHVQREIITRDEKTTILIMDHGLPNLDAGPDFFNAKIIIDETLWAGNIEIHVKSSDWEKHGHHTDKSYNNVILHLVGEHDKEVFYENGNTVLTAILTFDQAYLSNYKNLIRSEKQIACSDLFSKTEPMLRNTWLTTVLVERIESKTESLKMLLSYTGNNLEEAFYISLARSFGFKVNAVPFEWLAKSLPALILAKNKADKFKIEALLFGQAGFLNEEHPNDDYFNALKKEYAFLKVKYKLHPIEKHVWKFLRIRPANFPTLRIAQFASLVYKSSHLFSKVIETKTLHEIFRLFEPEANDYWNSHYRFGENTRVGKKGFGQPSVENIIVNTVLPMLFLYGKEKNNDLYLNRALNFFEQIKAEKNAVTQKWKTIGYEPKTAYESQACIQLYNAYCSKKRCLECRIGGKIVMK